MFYCAAVFKIYQGKKLVTRDSLTHTAAATATATAAKRACFLSLITTNHCRFHTNTHRFLLDEHANEAVELGRIIGR